MSRMDQINELLKEEIAQIVEKEVEMENSLITIISVDCSPDFSFAKINFSVIPDNVIGSALEKLKKNSGQIARALGKKVKLRKMPKLKWAFDSTEKNASELDKIFNKIENNEEVEDEIIYE